MKLLQINVCVNTGSTGRIVEQIGELVMSEGWESFIAYGRAARKSKSELIKVGGKVGIYWHVAMTRLFDRHGLHSRKATQALIRNIEKINPDIIHLHNIHGYYINYPILFDYLATANTPVVWTLHDCWAFTGHCAHYSFEQCRKWETECNKCPQIASYPKSYSDRSRKNFVIKKRCFSSLSGKVTITAVSDWLGGVAASSFLSCCDIEVVKNGIDTEIFYPRDSLKMRSLYDLKDKHVLLGVATAWDERKGLSDYIKLRECLSDDYVIILVGLTHKQISNLPTGILGITRTESIDEMAELYSMADIVLNLSYEETFGLTTVEGMACGTPGIVYNATASPELLTPETGSIVEPGNIDSLVEAISSIITTGKDVYKDKCRTRVVDFFEKDKKYREYLAIYNKLLNS